MGKNKNDVVHIEARRSWWSGRVTALCGWSAEPRGYQVYRAGAETCPTCKRLDRKGKRR